jgi:hypothetical protein
MTYFPLYPIRKFEHGPLKTIMKSGNIEVKDLSPILDEPCICLAGMPILASDYNVVLNESKGTATLIMNPIEAMRFILETRREPLWLFVQFQNELFIFKGIEAKDLQEIEIQGTKFARMDIPADRCIYGWVVK